MGGDARGFAVVTIVVGIVGGTGRRHAGAELARALGHIDSTGRTDVGTDGHAVDVHPVHVHVHRLDLDWFDGDLGPARRRGGHGRRAHQ